MKHVHSWAARTVFIYNNEIQAWNKSYTSSFELRDSRPKHPLTERLMFKFKVMIVKEFKNHEIITIKISILICTNANVFSSFIIHSYCNQVKLTPRQKTWTCILLLHIKLIYITSHCNDATAFTLPVYIKQ